MKRRSFLASLAALLGLRPKIAEPSATDFPDDVRLAFFPHHKLKPPLPPGSDHKYVIYISRETLENYVKSFEW